MTVFSPSTLVISDATQLERLTEIRDKLVAAPALEATLSECKELLLTLLVELGSKANSNEVQPVSGSVSVANFPATQAVSFPDAAPIAESPLTAIGSTPARSVSGYKYLTYQVDVTGIGTNAVVRIEGNLVGSNYDNLNPNNVDTTLTQNKSYLFTFEGKINNIRFTLVSFSGGAPSLTCHLLKGN